MKKIVALLFISFLLTSCMIQNPRPENCVVETAKIIKITEGPTYDIVFHDNGSERFYINRGLQNGLNLDSLNAKVLNKTVTLHLGKLIGNVTSEHIVQLAINDEIIYTEFK